MCQIHPDMNMGTEYEFVEQIISSKTFKDHEKVYLEKIIKVTCIMTHHMKVCHASGANHKAQYASEKRYESKDAGIKTVVEEYRQVRAKTKHQLLSKVNGFKFVKKTGVFDMVKR